MIAMNFKQLNLPSFDLLSELDYMLNKNQIEWGPINQICINSTPQKLNDIHYGAGSLYFDWRKTENNIPTVRQVELQESNFTEICNIFVGTVFEDVYLELKNNFNIGRIRLMKSKSKTCLTWHYDDTKRIHYPIITQDGCMMIIQDEVKHLPANTWWLTNTLVKHTALNASTENRIHLVVSLLDEDS